MNLDIAIADAAPQPRATSRLIGVAILASLIAFAVCVPLFWGACDEVFSTTMALYQLLIERTSSSLYSIRVSRVCKKH